MVGWGTFLGALGKLFDLIPIQGREERWRNELDNLNKEKKKLLREKADAKKAKRLIEVKDKIEYLSQLLKNVR
jgi:hypothetical protein